MNPTCVDCGAEPYCHGVLVKHQEDPIRQHFCEEHALERDGFDRDDLNTFVESSIRRILKDRK